MLVKHIVKQGLLLKNAGGLSRSYSYHGGPVVKVTMNDLPVPKGDWNERYYNNNRTYNAILATGVIFLASTIAFVKSTGIIHFNFSPPKSLD